MTTRPGTKPGAGFFDMQAAVGITKHTGGFAATRELHALCHVRDARDVLDVGCGIGVGPAYVARTYGSRVVALDISERMLGWARLRARKERVASRVALCAADVLALPFPDDSFDVVLCESVLEFVEDKARAIRECVRVARPGGHVGLNEGLWLKEPPPDLVEQVRAAVGPSVPTAEVWRSLWAASGLEDRVVRLMEVDPRAEVRSRLEWIGWPWLLQAWARAARLSLQDRSVRQAIKHQFDVPLDVFTYAGYGLLVGRKPG